MNLGMMTALGSLPSQLELDIKNPTGKCLYTKRFIMDMVKTNDFCADSHPKGTVEHEMSLLALNIPIDEKEVKARDVANQSWNI